MARNQLAIKLSLLTNHIICIILGFILIDCAICSTFIPSNDVKEQSKGANVCTTPGCFKAAELIKNNIDTTFEPCDKFYKFACGGFIRRTKLPSNKFGTLFDDFYEYAESLQVSIEQKINETDPLTFRLLHSFYNICLASKGDEIEHIADIINELGGWPVVLGDKWNEEKFSWNKTIHQMQKMGFVNASNSLIKFDISSDSQETPLKAKLDEPILGFDNELLITTLIYASNKSATEKVEQYFGQMISIAEKLGADPVEAKKQLKKSLDFEKLLAWKSQNPDSRTLDLSIIKSDGLYNNYLREMLSPIIYPDAYKGILSYNHDYLSSFAEMISSTPKDVLANYIIWRAVQELIAILDARKNEEYSREQICTFNLLQTVPVAVGALYARKNFKQNLKADTQEFVERIRKSYGHILSEADWMTENSKMAAQEKLDLMQAHVAYPDEYLDDKKLDDFHKTLKIHNESYIKSILSLKQFNRKYKLGVEIFNIQRPHWSSLAKTLSNFNAYYNPVKNDITLSAGYIQHALVNDRPNYLNYGLMGHTIGHEISHAFDPSGIQFNATGWKNDFWDYKTKSTYDERVQCINDQYRRYSYGIAKKRIPFDSEKKLNENIADIGGIKVAYRAYEEWEEQNGQEPSLPGLPYTPRQLFWIGAASDFCSKMRVSKGFDILLKDTHSPGAFRIIGPFSNMPEFARDFGCSVGSLINKPSKTCTLW